MMVTNESSNQSMKDESVSGKSSAGNINRDSNTTTLGDISESSLVAASSEYTADNIRGMSKEVMKHYDALTAKVFGIEVATTIAEILSDAEKKNRLSKVNLTGE